MHNSPRSVEACRRLGIEEHELLIKDFKDIEASEIPIQFHDNAEDFIRIKSSYYEHLRRKRVNQCLEV